ncbi:RHS repeat-associated core domain-containing protein [Methylomonas sp. BW4-1]|uniref:RHS repeat-associated core domain-containing protein n=1 Tax=Methylomonas sp. BW4-1 TaxID=3376685 RepID=UPI004041A0D0
MALHEQDNTQASSSTYHYHLDHLGTPRELTDTDGKIVWSARYRAYGNLALADVQEIDNPLRFQGQYYDQETGLHYNLNRYYDPNAGRFIHQDPIGLEGGANVYRYAPNPMNWIDPLGLTCSETPNETVGSLRAAGKKDAHHIIQDAAVRDLPGYNTNAAPGVQLPGPSNVSGTPHNLATAVQRQSGGGTYAAERRIGYKALRRSGIPETDARALIRQADDYFQSIGVNPDTVTRIPGNR